MSQRYTLYGACLLVVLAAGLGALIWFDVNGKGFRSWLEPQPVLSVVTLLVGFVVLGWQLRRQHENTLDANRRQSQDRLRLDIYNEIAKRIEATSVPLTEAGITPTAVVGELTIRVQNSMPSSHTPSSLLALGVGASRAVTELISVLEIYEIAMPEFVVFRRNLADAMQKLRVALGDFVPLAIPFVLVGKNGAPLRWPPDQAEMNQMSMLASVSRNTAMDVRAVIHDLRIDASNYLLGGLFGRQLARRAPTDPTMKVISIERCGARH